MGGRSGCSQWERGAGQHHELLQEWWGSNFPTPLSQEIHTLRKNRCQHWGLKPGMDVATRDLCPSLGWGDMAWTQLSLCGAWVSIHLSMHTFHSLRTPPGFLVAEAVPVPLSQSQGGWWAQPSQAPSSLSICHSESGVSSCTNIYCCSLPRAGCFGQLVSDLKYK